MYFGAKKYEKMKMSLILTIVSLGTRVFLAYLLAPSFGVEMIWWIIVIGWILADTIGILYGIIIGMIILLVFIKFNLVAILTGLL